MQRFLGCLLESALFQLNFLSKSASLDVGEEERLDEIFDKGFVVVESSFEAL